MTDKDIRWIQRLGHFSKALSRLNKFIEKGALNELEKQGLIQAFEYTYELAWNTIKDYFEDQGETGINGSRDSFRLAFKRGLILHGQIWMDMVASRTLTTHTYDENVAEIVAGDIVNKYHSEFVTLRARFEELKDKPA